MNADIAALAAQALYLSFRIAFPVVMASAGVGVLVSLLQAVTHIQDQALPFLLKLLAAGLSNGEIARDLFISEHTVKTHINHLFGKTKSRDRAQAIRYAHEHELA